jgi:hypothetical protein
MHKKKEIGIGLLVVTIRGIIALDSRRPLAADLCCLDVSRSGQKRKSNISSLEMLYYSLGLSR